MSLKEAYDLNVSKNWAVAPDWDLSGELRFKRLRGDVEGLVLDVGCDVGTMTRCFEKWGCKVVAVDFNPYTLRLAKKHTERSSEIDYILAAGQNLPLKEDVFHSIHLGETLEHNYDPYTMVAEALRCLKTGGKLLITVPTPEWKKHALEVPKSHVKEFTFEDLQRLMDSFNLEYSISILESPERSEYRFYVRGIKKGFRVLRSLHFKHMRKRLQTVSK